MTDKTPPLFVVPGGPGAGKTTLIDALARAGFRRGTRGRAAHHSRTAGIRWPRAAMDRSLAVRRSDAGSRCSRVPVPRRCTRAGVLRSRHSRRRRLSPARRRASSAALRAGGADAAIQRRAFICPPWPQIYGTDSERRQTPEIAEKTYRMMVATYGDYGYELVEVPRASTNECVRFLLEAIDA